MAVVESSADGFPSNIIPALPRKFSHHQDELSDPDPLEQHQVKDQFLLHHLHSHNNSVILQENNLHNDSNIHLRQQENMLKKEKVELEQNQITNKKTDSDAAQWNYDCSYESDLDPSKVKDRFLPHDLHSHNNTNIHPLQKQNTIKNQHIDLDQKLDVEQKKDPRNRDQENKDTPGESGQDPLEQKQQNEQEHDTFLLPHNLHSHSYSISHLLQQEHKEFNLDQNSNLEQKKGTAHTLEHNGQIRATTYSGDDDYIYTNGNVNGEHLAINNGQSEISMASFSGLLNRENVALISGQTTSLENVETRAGEETTITSGNVVETSECRSNGDLQKQFNQDSMRELEDLLSKLNPLAEEFVPSSSTVSESNSTVKSSNRKKKNNYNVGRKMSNSRMSKAQLEECVRRTVYVSDIDHQITEEQLASLFLTCGQVVDCRVCGDPNSVLRFAFVEFTDEEGARTSLGLSGTMLGFYPLRVLPSKTAILPVNPTFLPRSENEREMCARTVYCTNIDKKVAQADIKLFFETVCGEVARLRLLGDYRHSTRIAFVEFVRAGSAMAALSCSGAILGSLPLRVSPSKTPVRPRSPRLLSQQPQH